jgi:spore coat polysaccharide biosynthesis protein SpsF (cytidylyltransferase family)
MVASIQAVAVIDLGMCDQPGERLALRYVQRSLKGQSLLRRMVRQLQESQLVQNLCISGAAIPDSIGGAGIPGTELLNLPQSHLIDRLAAAAERSQAEWIVYVRGNRPFVDPVLVDRLLAEAQRHDECDYVGFFSKAGGWRRMAHLGLAGEVCHVDSLRRLRRHIEPLMLLRDDGCLVTFFQDAEGVFQMRFIAVPTELDRSDLRFAVESEDDWDDIQSLGDALPADEMQWQKIAMRVLANATMREGMESRNGGDVTA